MVERIGSLIASWKATLSRSPNRGPNRILNLKNLMLRLSEKA